MTGDLDRFRYLIEAYGAEIERWPETERDFAAALLGGSDAARALHRDAAALDALLDAATTPRPSPELMAAVLSDAAAPPWRVGLRMLWPFGPVWKPASALVFATVLGLVVGIAVPPDGAVPTDSEISDEIDRLIVDANLTGGALR